MLMDNISYLRCRAETCDFSESWDIFVSAYNASERVQHAHSRANSGRKIWVVLPEYGYESGEIESLVDCVVVPSGSNEVDVVGRIVAAIGEEKLEEGVRLCIDITGFMRPHIMAFVAKFYDIGLVGYSMMYSEPGQYRERENTSFSGDDVECVRQVVGFEGLHDDDVASDVLIVGMGYDDGLVSRVITDKEGARLIQLLSLPSLSADMYQESILRLDRVSISVPKDEFDGVFFAPANDPFVVASELSRVVSKLRSASGRNVYLCPLATKAQALGFAIFYMNELRGTASSILFPFSRTYGRDTSSGVGKCWIYEVDIPALAAAP